MIGDKCEYDSGWEQGHVEGVLDERKRIIALAKERAEKFRRVNNSRGNRTAAAFAMFAHELEAENG